MAKTDEVSPNGGKGKPTKDSSARMGKRGARRRGPGKENERVRRELDAKLAEMTGLDPAVLKVGVEGTETVDLTPRVKKVKVPKAKKPTGEDGKLSVWVSGSEDSPRYELRRRVWKAMEELKQDFPNLSVEYTRPGSVRLKGKPSVAPWRGRPWTTVEVGVGDIRLSLAIRGRRRLSKKDQDTISEALEMALWDNVLYGVDWLEAVPRITRK